jgi:hypothetical protein
MKTKKTNCQNTITTQTFYSTLVHLSPLSVRASFFTFALWVRFEAFVSSRKSAKKGAGDRAPLSCRRSFVGEASSIAAAAAAVVRRRSEITRRPAREAVGSDSGHASIFHRPCISRGCCTTSRIEIVACGSTSTVSSSGEEAVLVD